MSTTSGRNLLKGGDKLYFRREPLQNSIMVSGSSAVGGKSAASKGKAARAAQQAKLGKAGAAAAAKAAKAAKGAGSSGTGSAQPRPQRILRFSTIKPGAALGQHLSLTSTELGTAPRHFADAVTPLFDRELIDLEASCIYCPERVEVFSSIAVSVSVFVLPRLFEMSPSSAALAAAAAAAAAGAKKAPRMFGKAAVHSHPQLDVVCCSGGLHQEQGQEEAC